MRTTTRRVALIGLTILLEAVRPSALQLPAPEKNVSLRLLDKGNQSQIEDSEQVVARTEDEWMAFWRRHASNRPRAAVDFSREMVVGLFLGTQPTAGFSVEVVSSRLEGETMVVRYRSARPPQDAIVVQMLTSPYHLVAVPRHSGEVRFEKTE